MILIIVVARGLFWFRDYSRNTYGLLEMALGIVAGWYGVSKLEAAGLTEGISIIAAVYLIVRGLDNHTEAMNTAMAEEQSQALKRQALKKSQALKRSRVLKKRQSLKKNIVWG